MHQPRSADLSSLLALDVLTLIIFDTCRYVLKPFAWYCCFDGQRQTHCHPFSIVYFVITPTAAHPSQSVYVLTEEPHPQISPMILMVPVDGHFETTAPTMGARLDTISMEAQSRAGRINSSAKANDSESQTPRWTPIQHIQSGNRCCLSKWPLIDRSHSVVSFSPSAGDQFLHQLPANRLSCSLPSNFSQRCSAS